MPHAVTLNIRCMDTSRHQDDRHSQDHRWGLKGGGCAVVGGTGEGELRGCKPGSRMRACVRALGQGGGQSAWHPPGGGVHACVAHRRAGAASLHNT